MGDREIPDNCPECGGHIRLGEPVQQSAEAEKVFRCKTGCFERRVR